jgi:hypothetical protein
MSALTEAMRKKFGSPKEAIKALGLDESLLALDSAEAVKMPTQFASTAALLAGTAIRPLLKPKAKIDLMPVFKDLTAEGFDADEFKGALDAALKGKLAKGSDLKLAYDNFMPHVEGMAKGGDESVSKEQHNAMEAAAHGNSTLGIPPSVGKEFAEADKGKTFDNLFMKKAMDWMRGSGMDESALAKFAEHMGKPPAQDAEEEEPEEVTEGFKNVEQHAEDRPRARDARARDGYDRRADDRRADDRRADDRRADDRRADDRRADDRRADDGDAHHAMDEDSINRRIAEAVKGQEQKLKAKFAAAERAREYIGQVDPMAFDTGEAIDRHVLKVKGYKRWNTVHVDAIPDVMGTITKIGMRPVERMAQDSKFGIDETRRADACKLAPGLANIRIGV